MSSLLAGHGPLAGGWWACQRVEAPPSDDSRFPTWYRTSCGACQTALRAAVIDGCRWAMGVRLDGAPFNQRIPEGVGFVAAHLLLGPGVAGAQIDAILCPWLDEPPEQLIVARQSLTYQRSDGTTVAGSP